MIEMLVIIGIVSLIFALLLPAVISAREDARRSQCRDHQFKMILAVLNYESAFERFPPAGWISEHRANDTFSVFALMLPYLDNYRFANLLNFDISPEIQTTITHAVIGILVCPSDRISYPLKEIYSSFTDGVPHTIDSHPFPINYGLNLGNWKIYDPADRSGGNGAFVFGTPLRNADLSDGTSTTIAITEGISYQPTLRGNARMFSHEMKPPMAPADVDTFRNRFEARGGHASWASADPLQTGMTIWFPPNSKVPFDVDENEHSIDYINAKPGESASIPSYAVITPRSYHKDCVNAAMMDGSVRMIRNSIELRTFRALGTRAGAENVEELTEF